MTQPLAVNSIGVLIRHCPICERFKGHKVHITRKSASEYATCKECGWLWHAANCKCTTCAKRNGHKSDLSLNGREIQ